jgi:hypothetical protein
LLLDEGGGGHGSKMKREQEKGEGFIVFILFIAPLRALSFFLLKASSSS